MITGLHHIQLAMPMGLEEKARHFYESVLGLSEVAKPPQLATRGGCWFEGNGVKVHLGVEHPFVAARKAHPAFLVDNLRTLTKQISRAGYIVTEDDALPDFDRIYVSDPFGNRIELLQPV